MNKPHASCEGGLGEAAQARAADGLEENKEVRRQKRLEKSRGLNDAFILSSPCLAKCAPLAGFVFSWTRQGASKRGQANEEVPRAGALSTPCSFLGGLDARRIVIEMDDLEAKVISGLDVW